MKFMKQLVLTVLLLIVFIGCEKQTPKNAPTERIDAAQLEKDIWAKFNDASYLEKMINEEFQSSHSDGARNKTDEIKLIQKLNIKKHQFSDFRATQNGNVAVVTYNIAVTVTLENKEVELPPSQRISVWQKTDEGWQWMAHANLNPLVK